MPPKQPLSIATSVPGNLPQTQDFTRRNSTGRLINGPLRQESTEQSETSDARTQARHPAQRPFGQEGEEQEAGDCDRPVRSTSLGRQGAAQEIEVEEVVLSPQEEIADYFGRGF